VAEPWGEPLELRLDAPGHVDRRSVRDVAVRPNRFLPAGPARTVEKALLAHEHEGMFGDATPRHVLFALADLVERPAEVHGPRAKAVPPPPRDRPTGDVSRHGEHEAE